MTDVGVLISGFRSFKATEYPRFKNIIEHVVQLNLKPKTMFICCSDMRLPPGKIFGANPGDLYVIRNLGALIPPYQEGQSNEIVASIEYAADVLEVDNIIVMGHAYCDAVRSYFAEGGENKNLNPAVHQWLSISREAKEAVCNHMKDKTPQEQEIAFEQEIILVSLKNLLSYPSVAKRIKNKSVQLYGWLFNIKEGMVAAFDPNTRSFIPIE
jgi:carbonic anhydrase